MPYLRRDRRREHRELRSFLRFDKHLVVIVALGGCGSSVAVPELRGGKAALWRWVAPLGAWLSTRRVRGWISDERPVPVSGETDVTLRRYRCVQPGCGSVLLVGPAEWASRRRYLRTTIAWALYL